MAADDRGDRAEALAALRADDLAALQGGPQRVFADAAHERVEQPVARREQPALDEQQSRVEDIDPGTDDLTERTEFCTLMRR